MSSSRFSMSGSEFAGGLVAMIIIGGWFLLRKAGHIASFHEFMTGPH